MAQAEILSGLGNGTLGIAAGTQGEATYIAIADRQQGTFLRYEVGLKNSSSGNGGPPLLEVINGPDSIKSGVQHPQGVAINSDAYDASRCAIEGGCVVRRTVRVEYVNQEFGDSLDTMFANIFVVPDTPDRRDRNGFMSLNQHVSDRFDQRFRIPPSCRGFPTPQDPANTVLVVLDINTTVTPVAGAFVQTQELLNQIIPGIGTCDETGARLFYHPDAFSAQSEPERGTLYDTTYICTNPSRSISREQSPMVICADDYFKLVRNSDRITGQLARQVRQEVEARIANLKTVVGNLSDASLRGQLTTILNDTEKLVKGGNPDYIAASAKLDEGAVLVAKNKGNNDPFEAGITTDSKNRDTLYGDLLGRFLALAFFTKESLGQQTYAVPFDVCTVEGQLEGCS